MNVRVSSDDSVTTVVGGSHFRPALRGHIEGHAGGSTLQPVLDSSTRSISRSHRPYWSQRGSWKGSRIVCYVARYQIPSGVRRCLIAHGYLSCPELLAATVIMLALAVKTANSNTTLHASSAAPVPADLTELPRGRCCCTRRRAHSIIR